MTYGPEEVSRDLRLVLEGTASFEARAQLENFLLTVLREQGNGAVSALLLALPEHGFRLIDDPTSGPEGRYVSGEPGGRRLVVATFLGPQYASVNVTSEDESTRPEPDPRHRAFYEVWEGLLGIPDSAVLDLDPRETAVFLVGLLESEVMNGGLGQYLTNTDGVHLEDTVQCLAQIGAGKTRAILIEAAKLGRAADSFVAAWESKSEDFERLDIEFLESGEDLAALTVDAFPDWDY